MPPIRVLIAEDQTFYRENYLRILEATKNIVVIESVAVDARLDGLGQRLQSLAAPARTVSGHYQGLASPDADICRGNSKGRLVMNLFQSLRDYERFVYTLPHPHHKHIPPDIKHHRIPVPDLSFKSPNLSFLIQEIEHALLQEEK